MIGASFGNYASSGGGFTGLLDDYPNAAAAYSVRRLSSTYEGSLIEVRRSSDNTTQDIGYDVNGDLDTTALLAFVGAGDGFVRTWYDQSGNSLNAQNTTTSGQPQIVSSGTILTSNGKPAIKPKSNSDRLFTDSTTLPAERSYFIVSENVGAQYGANHGLILINGSPFGQIYQSSTQLLYFIGVNISFGGISYSGNQVISLTQSTSEVITYINGVQQAVNSSGTRSDITGIIFLMGFSTYATNGYFNEVIVYSSDQTSNETGIHSNILDFYGI